MLLPSRTDLFSATDLCFKTSSPSPEVTEQIGRVPLYSFSLSLSAFRTYPPVSVSCTVFPRDSFQCSLDSCLSSLHFSSTNHRREGNLSLSQVSFLHLSPSRNRNLRSFLFETPPSGFAFQLPIRDRWFQRPGPFLL